jgi:hypothetical protein
MRMVTAAYRLAVVAPRAGRGRRAGHRSTIEANRLGSRCSSARRRQCSRQRNRSVRVEVISRSGERVSVGGLELGAVLGQQCLADRGGRRAGPARIAGAGLLVEPRVARWSSRPPSRRGADEWGRAGPDADRRLPPMMPALATPIRVPVGQAAMSPCRADVRSHKGDGRHRPSPSIAGVREPPQDMAQRHRR